MTTRERALLCQASILLYERDEYRQLLFDMAARHNDKALANYVKAIQEISGFMLKANEDLAESLDNI